MKREGRHLSSRAFDEKHDKARIAKLEKIQGLKALLESWEERDNFDHSYLVALRARLRTARNQYNAMRP